MFFCFLFLFPFQLGELGWWCRDITVRGSKNTEMLIQNCTRDIISKGNTPPNAISELKFALHFSLASSGLERHQRNCYGVLSLYSLNIDIPKVICLNSIGLQ